MNTIEVFTEVESKYNEALRQSKGLIVAISGRSCSGKTTLANQLKCFFSKSDPVVLSEDSWYKDLKDINRDDMGYYDMENISSFCIAELKNDLLSLMENSCYMPNYDVANNTRKSKNLYVKNSNLIILEGLHSIDIVENLDCKYDKCFIFVDTPIDKCIERRANRDFELYEVPKEMVKNHYNSVIEKHYSPYIESQILIVKQERGIFLDE